MSDPTLGLDPTLGGVAGIGLVVAKSVLYPLVQLARPNGVPYVPASLQSGVVLLASGALGAVLALLTGSPVLPAMSATIVGLSAARAAHEMARPK
jgi:hypothetical protein